VGRILPAGLAAQAIRAYWRKVTPVYRLFTVDVESAKNTAQASLKTYRHYWPLSNLSLRWYGGASGGTLTFMAGGSERRSPTLSPCSTSWDQRAVHCGDAGAGQGRENLQQT